MTTYNKNTLKTFFVTGAVPGGNDYGNLIDSQINIVETAVQNMAGPLGTTELSTARVSAGNVNVTGTLTVAGTFSANALNATNSIVGATLSLSGAMNAASLTVTSDVSATGGTVYASAMRSSFTYSVPVIISAAGTAQATGAVLTAQICRLQGAADGVTTGFALPANKTGWVQYLANECAVSANLWPPTGGTINGLGANAVFPMAANTPYIVIHRAASAYSVK